MNIKKNNKQFIFHFVYWIVILIYYISSKWPLEEDKVFLLEKMVLFSLVQIALTYSILYFIIPVFLQKKKKLLFLIFCFLAVYASYVLFTAIRCYYLVPNYPNVFKYRPPLIFEERITNGFAYLNNITSLVFPTIILMVINYYRQQKEIMGLREQKKTSELEVLKNQLNPHFLFNTLNNLYALSLKKSDKTPEVIERLSGILDYMLFKCKDKYVSILGEIELLENYIALEKLRYGKRLDITFNHYVENDVKIGPLLLLTFTENAFKHGVEEELTTAFIKIDLKVGDKEIYFNIENSIPNSSTLENVDKRESLGLKNIKKQLELLYSPNKYIINLIEKDNIFCVILKLIPNEV